MFQSLVSPKLPSRTFMPIQTLRRSSIVLSNPGFVLLIRILGRFCPQPMVGSCNSVLSKMARWNK